MKRNIYMNKSMDFLLSFLTKEEVFTASLGCYKIVHAEILNKFKMPPATRIVVSKKPEEVFELRLVYGEREVVATLSDVKADDRFGVAHRELVKYNGYRSYPFDTFEYVLAKEQLSTGIVKPVGYKVFKLRENQHEYVLKNGTRMIGYMKSCLTKEIMGSYQLGKVDAHPAYFWPTLLVPAHEQGTEPHKEDVQEFATYIAGCKKFIKEAASEVK